MRFQLAALTEIKMFEEPSVLGIPGTAVTRFAGVTGGHLDRLPRHLLLGTVARRASTGGFNIGDPNGLSEFRGFWMIQQLPGFQIV